MSGLPHLHSMEQIDVMSRGGMGATTGLSTKSNTYTKGTQHTLYAPYQNRREAEFFFALGYLVIRCTCSIISMLPQVSLVTYTANQNLCLEDLNIGKDRF